MRHRAISQGAELKKNFANNDNILKYIFSSILIFLIMCIYQLLIGFDWLWRNQSLVNSTVFKSVIMVAESVPSSNFYNRRVDETLHQAQITNICEWRDNSALNLFTKYFVSIAPLVELHATVIEDMHIKRAGNTSKVSWTKYCKLPAQKWSNAINGLENCRPMVVWK